MKRSIVAQGLSKTSFVSLPIKWVRKYGLKPSDTITVDEAGPRLILSAQKTIAHQQTICLDQAHLLPYEYRILRELYIAGYDCVHIFNIRDQKSMAFTKQALQSDVIGMSITEETRTAAVFECVVAETEEQFQKYEQKAFQTMLQTFVHLRNCLVTGDYSTQDEIESLGSANNRFVNYCLRYLNKTGHRNYALAYVCLGGVESITDDCRRALLLGSLKKTKLPKQVIDYFDKVHTYVQTVYQLYFKYEPELLKTLVQERKEIRKQGETIISILPQITNRIMNAALIAFDMVGPIVARHYSEIEDQATTSE